MKHVILAVLTIATLALACGNSATSADPVVLGADPDAGKGEQIFRMHCVLCHGSNGKLGFNGAKDLTISPLTKAEMIARVTEGKGTMQAYKHVLTAKEIEAAVDHTRSLKKKK